MNFDRNPGDVDFFEYGFQAALGVGGRAELFLRASPFLRTNSVNQEPFGYPVPPLDLFVDTYPNVALRAQPYFLYAQEVPFKSYHVDGVWIDPPGHGAFGSSSGDIGIGVKVNLLSEDRDEAFGFGIRGYVEIPTEQPMYNTLDWRRMAGVSGQTDVGAELLFGKRLGVAELIVNVGYEHVGDPDRGLRVQLVDSSKLGTPGFLVGAPIETGLDLHDQLSFTSGTSLRAFNVNGMQFWMIGEISYTRYVAGGTAVERLVHPGEMRLGIQTNAPKFPRVSLGAAWQLLFNDAGHGTVRQTMFQTQDGRGDINFTEGVDPERSAAYLALFAAHGATFSSNSSKVFSTNNPLFDASRNIPSGNTSVVGMGGGNILGWVTWRIN